MIRKSKYWNFFYEKKSPPVYSSNFSKFILKSKFLDKNTQLFDLGCGNGRDTLFFLKKKFKCIGFDKSSTVIKKIKIKNPRNKNNFYVIDFSKLKFDKLTKKNFSLYLRFSLHALQQKEENNFFKNIYKLKKLRFIFIETRTIFDHLYGKGIKVGTNAFYTDHYRRFADPEILKKKLEKKFKIVFFELGKNFAKYKNENPKVLRICCKKK